MPLTQQEQPARWGMGQAQRRPRRLVATRWIQSSPPLKLPETPANHVVLAGSRKSGLKTLNCSGEVQYHSRVPTASAVTWLSQFLTDRFNADELRQLAYSHGGPELYKALPPSPNSTAQLAFDLAQRLADRGLLNRDLLAALVRKRPAFKAVLVQQHELFGGASIPPSTLSDDERACTENVSTLGVSLTAPKVPGSYFDGVRDRLNLKTLRTCQQEAFWALADYYGSGSRSAACVMAVGAGKTALGITAVLAFTRRRALIVSPGKVIRSTFDKALNHTALGNVLYGLPGGPLIPGLRPPAVLTLDGDEGPVREITGDALRAADIIITNFHLLGTGGDADDLLAKLAPDDIDIIVVDEAHIAASESYQRLFAHFSGARTLLMSACFQRLDGKPIDADIVYRYRLIDSIADGNAKNLRIERFAPESDETVYEMVWPDGSREEIVGREELLTLIGDERKLGRIVAKSDASIRQVMRVVRDCLDRQREVLAPVKPRCLFSALGDRHAAQITRIAEAYGIATAYLHHAMTDSAIRAVRNRFEQESGDLDAVVQLKMLGQGYDFPPISIVVPMRPYGSFSEFYQFVGRGIRVLLHPAVIGRVAPDQQFLDVVYHAEFGLDRHIDTIYRENDMDRPTVHNPPTLGKSGPGDLPGSTGVDTAMRPDTFVLFEPGSITSRVVHDQARVEQRRLEREREALAAQYSAYASTSDSPVTFEKFTQLLKEMRE